MMCLCDAYLASGNEEQLVTEWQKHRHASLSDSDLAALQSIKVQMMN